MLSDIDICVGGVFGGTFHQCLLEAKAQQLFSGPETASCQYAQAQLSQTHFASLHNACTTFL